MKRRAVLLLAVMTAALIMVAIPAWATTFTVNSTADTGDATPDGICDSDPAAGVVCTLREAIQEANAPMNPGPDTINFAIPDTDCSAGVCTINSSSELPLITDPVIIDGYSQPGASANTLAVGNDAVLKIELSGPDALNGLKIEADNSTVQGLIISNWENGIWNFSDDPLDPVTNVRIEGNFIGTDATGTVTDPDGNPNSGDELGNGLNGVLIRTGAANNTIGGTTAAAGNIISGNGNSGSDPSLNTLSGVEVQFDLNDLPSKATGNRILSNSIYDNVKLGIDLYNTNNPPGVTDNDIAPLDTDDGPNHLQNFPVIKTAKLTTRRIGGHRRKVTIIKGTLNSNADTTFIVQFFGSPEADPSGFGEGKKFLGQKSVNTNNDGDATFTFQTRKKVPKGQFVTATATVTATASPTATDQSVGDTSEFSKACMVPGVPCP